MGWDFVTTLAKRACRSFLKKKLGDFLLGDIDLDQLDLQLLNGTLHLSDLALNADFINQKIAGSALILKEGSMRSLSIKIRECCEIEVEDLELIIAPCITTDIPITTSDCSTSSCCTEGQQAKDLQKVDPGYSSSNAVASVDVDEGVKRIAKTVKQFLTGFHIRIKNSYIVFDPSTNSEVRNSASDRSLVLRIEEAEFGTCLYENVKLDNFMNFKGAVLEFLQMEEIEKNNSSNGDITTPVLKGPIGGFSGTLNLSIPWKGKSPCLQKLDAVISIDALELNVWPSTLDWALAVWKSLQLLSSRRNEHKGMELSAFSSSLNISSANNVSKGEVHTPKVQGKTQDKFLGETHFIQNWVPKLADKDEKGALDSDYDDENASIDQFFECFEGMRSSQMVSGNNGIWNWTCSVFNAITCANTLACGENHLPPEQLTEKTLHAAISEMCIIIYFDERKHLSTEGREFEFYMSCFSSMHPDQSSMTETDINNIKLQHLEAHFQEISLDVQTYPQNVMLKASVGETNVDEFYNGRCNEQIFITPELKRDIQGSLPPFSFDEPDAGRYGTNSQTGLVRVSLLKSFGECNFTYATSLTGSNRDSTTASLIISLPPFTFWVHFHLLHMLIELINRVGSFFKESQSTQMAVAKSLVKSEHPESTLKCRIVLPQLRIFLGFPSEFNWDFSHPSSFDRFVVFDHFVSLHPNELKREILGEYQTSSSSSVHLDVQNLNAYLIEPCNQNFSATKIISTSNSTVGHGFGVNFSWQASRVTDPWILSRAWSLATLHNQKSVKRHAGKGSGSSSTSLNDLKVLHDTCSNIRQELILSTQSLLHVKLSRVLIDLSKKHYVLLLSLVDQVVHGLSNAVHTSEGEVDEKNELISKDNSSLQTSIFLECGTLDVCAQLDEVMDVSHLLQRELKGSWKGLKLCIKDFELLSVSNLGGVKDARFMWVNHGEGKLLGSIISQPQISSMESSKDFLLVVCSDSASGRGDGVGSNALYCGKAGTSFITMFNPESLENYSSIIVCCATVVAPGGRLDWINAIVLFFILPSQDVEESRMDGAVNGQPVGTSSFYLDLMDVALSYEPHVENPAENTETSSLGPSFFFEPDAKMEKQCVACFVAASSLSLSNNTMSNSTSIDHDIHLQDLGLLIAESDGSAIIAHGSSPDYLRRVGYIRVAQNPLIAAALRTSGKFWKLEMTDSSFNIDLCRDTLFGLIRLASQLQQIYAPDMQDALDHLQSRWNSMQLKEAGGLGSSHSRVSEGEKESLSVSEEGSRAGGLLDEIVENVFYAEEKNGPFDYYAVNLPYEDAAVGFEGEYVTSFSPEIIDTYCSPDFPSSSSRNHISSLLNEDCDRGTGGWYGDGPLNIVEDHISEARSSTEGDSSDQGGSYYFDTVESAEVPYNLKGQVALRKIDVNLRMFAGNDWSKETPSCSLRNQRDGDSCLELTLVGLDLCYDMYPDDEIRVSKMCVSAQDMNLFDRSKNAPWKMILGRYSSKDYPRESCSKAFKLELESIRPEPPTPLEDYRLQLEILPLRLHLDQGQLNFLVTFFQNETCDSDSSSLLPHDSDQLESSARRSTSSSGSQAIVEEALLPFFQKFDLRPLVVRVDYIPRQFDPVALSRGNYAEILNLVPWKGIDLKLKSVSAVGVYGWGSICETVLGEWLEDISHNQVHKLLKGLPPIRSLFAVSSGTSKLVSLPIKSYRKDGKLLKGMQRGAVAFIRSISIEAVGLGVHLAAGAHEILLKTECILTSVPPIPQFEGRRKSNVRSNQPDDAQQGIQQAYESLTEGLGRTASAIIRTPLKVYQHGAGAGSALATAFCSAPGAVIAPISASAGAVHYALLGLRNSLDPEHKRESIDKYLGPSQS